jgi:hypothetical protein
MGNCPILSEILDTKQKHSEEWAIFESTFMKEILGGSFCIIWLLRQNTLDLPSIAVLDIGRGPMIMMLDTDVHSHRPLVASSSSRCRRAPDLRGGGLCGPGVPH